MSRAVLFIRVSLCAAFLTLLAAIPVAFPLHAADIPAEHKPDPKTIQKDNEGYRYTQAGWVVLHIEGDPYPRGLQHGKLLANEIAKYIVTLGRERNPKDGTDGWRTVRTLTDALFLRKLDKEFLEEMKGIADGAAEAGAMVDDRKVDLLDIVSINVWQEIDTLESALAATPTGLEKTKLTAPVQPKKEHCSAFVATGPATADGKVVLGHITMFGLHFGPHVNVWIDCKPTKGNRFAMQGFPGAVWSSQDYYMNAAGIVLCETTIDQTPFDATGEPLTTRSRKAIQYSNNIDDVVKYLSQNSNGLYSNEWLIADTKTNEIAMYELGTKKSKLWRSSKNEWFNDTKGFYWGCNNAKDLAVRMEAAPAAEPDSVKAWEADGRDKAWLKFYETSKGKIDVAAAKAIFATEELALPHSLDAKFTTTKLAKELASYALYGPPTGKEWKPNAEDTQNHPGIKSLISHPWTVLTINAPLAFPAPEAKEDKKPEKPRAVPTPWQLPAK
ncbi:MAG: hypothetical protein K8U57_24515 [Planctomycetes bacterium]|nr:hypothetical protein [Planctomycetota bacterium]